MSKPVLLLDLGGVLADLGDPAAAMRLDMTTDEFWRIWLTSPAVRALETGRMAHCEFFPTVAAELGCAGDGEFEQRFRAWELVPYAGLETFVARAADQFHLALLSNTSDIHWAQFNTVTPVFSTFAQVFLSYETGLFKPAPDAFRQVIEHFGVAPGQVTFLDDTQRNVDAARALGIDAHCVVGLEEARRCVERE